MGGREKGGKHVQMNGERDGGLGKEESKVGEKEKRKEGGKMDSPNF